jgi:peptide/nickel transport system permease protein
MKKHLAFLLMAFVCIYVFNFFVPRLMPGDPFSFSDYADSTDTNNMMTEAQKKAMLSYYHLDRPLTVQFAETVRKNLSGDLGDSIYYKKPVWTAISARVGWSFYIVSMTMGLSLILGMALAFLSIWRPRADRVIYPFMTLAAETPAFLIGIALLFLVAAQVNWIPLAGAADSLARYANHWEKIKDIALHSFMPLSAMAIAISPMIYFTARTSFLTVKQKKYVLAAEAKGLSPWRIRFRYILANAMAPIAARFFMSAGACVGATLLIENVFAYPGLGKLMRDAVQYRDYPLIQGVFLVVTAYVLLCSFLSDVIAAYHDRRWKLD